MTDEEQEGTDGTEEGIEEGQDEGQDELSGFFDGVADELLSDVPETEDIDDGIDW